MEYNIYIYTYNDKEEYYIEQQSVERMDDRQWNSDFHSSLQGKIQLKTNLFLIIFSHIQTINMQFYLQN